MGSIPEVTLSLGGKGMPVIGLGTVTPTRNDPQGVKTAVLTAIELGYRHFDTAPSYGSEKPLGEAVAEAIDLGLIESRDELFITSKLPYESVAQHLVLPALQMSLRNLQMDYLDLYLIHWPLRLKPGVTQFPVKKDDILPFEMKPVWQAMEETHNLGLARAIGVSNFSIKLLNELLADAVIPPAVNQVEMNTAWQQVKMLEFCKRKGIHVTGYSPLGANGTRWGDNRIVENPVLEEIGKPKGKSAAQVSLRWIHEQGASMVVKSFNKERMKTNLQIFDWKLTEEDLKKISQLPQRKGVIPSLMLNEAFKDFDNET